MKLSGTTFIHNGIEHDYCFEQCIGSMLGCCDEVVVVEAGSTDGTLERLWQMAQADARLRVARTEWKPAPLVQETGTDWTADLANMARTLVSHPMNLYVQADEVVHEEDWVRVRELAATGGKFVFQRLNFWGGARTVAPPGRVCGHLVTRLAPNAEPVLWGSETIDPRGAVETPVRLFHYGFVRRGDGFRKKSEIMGRNFTGAVDPIIYRAEREGIGVLREAWPETELVAFTGTHPERMREWLRERGHEL